MRILAFKAGHDGAAAMLEDGTLHYSAEAEKDSYPRYEALHPEMLMGAFARAPAIPDVLAYGGWHRGMWGGDLACGAGYFGHDESNVKSDEITAFGRVVRRFTSSHERSHLMCSYGLSPFPQGQPCYALVWEGHIGAFYEIDEDVRVTKLADVLPDVGIRYLYLYHLGKSDQGIEFGAAGKLMALAAYGTGGPPSSAEGRVLDYVMNSSELRFADAPKMVDLPVCGIGVEALAFKDLARKFTDVVFHSFHRFAVENLTRGLPLLIGGGCGLNCEWNVRWRECGLFEDVFVPPCCNDSGSALGTAIDAQRHYTGSAKVQWSVFAGDEFILDCSPNSDDWSAGELDFHAVARLLRGGGIVAWVDGRFEIGPRALGHRSLLAEPFSTTTRDRLNTIKCRESYRPVAPVCLESDFDQYFRGLSPSPHMLLLHRVTDSRLRGITHVDGSARVQTVGDNDKASVVELLRAFRALTGCAVLSNTSLNLPGRGFINRMSHLVQFARDRQLDAFVVNGRQFFSRRRCTASMATKGA